MPQRKPMRHIVFFIAACAFFVLTAYAIYTSMESENSENQLVLLSRTQQNDFEIVEEQAAGPLAALSGFLYAQTEPAAGEENIVMIPRTKLPRDRAKADIDENTFALVAGQNLIAALQDNVGLSYSAAYKATKAMEEVYDPRGLKVGQVFTFRSTPTDEVDADTGKRFFALHQLSFRPTPETEIHIQPKNTGEGEFTALKTDIELETRLVAQEGVIDSSLFAAGEAAGVPSSVLGDLIFIYSWDVDFQRDVQRGDRFRLLYEELVDDKGEVVKYGRVLTADLAVRGQDNPVYRMQLKDGTIDYFKPDGMSVKRALLRTPVDGARISSGFGLRRHPILGYNKMHKGVDFAAPSGTPIYAAGDGVIEKIGPWSSFGNYIRIRHRNGIKTAYAHLKGFKKGLRVGSRVKQRDVIGYVGTTGRSTGPHLHYEVHLNGEKVNPRGVKLPTGIQLKGSELAALKSKINEYDTQLAQALADGAQPNLAIGPITTPPDE